MKYNTPGPHPPAPSPNNGRGGEEGEKRGRRAGKMLKSSRASLLLLPLSHYWERGLGGEGRLA